MLTKVDKDGVPKLVQFIRYIPYSSYCEGKDIHAKYEVDYFDGGKKLLRLVFPGYTNTRNIVEEEHIIMAELLAENKWRSRHAETTKE